MNDGQEATQRTETITCEFCGVDFERPVGSRGRPRFTHEACGTAQNFLAAFFRGLAEKAAELTPQARSKIRSKVQSELNSALNVAGDKQRAQVDAEKKPGTATRFGGSRAKKKA